jgi:mono/diheme cytochrome c family protein
MVSGGAPRAASASSDGANVAAMRLLKAECFSCHNQEKKKGGLVLTSRERLLEGGDSGVVVVPRKPDESMLMKVLATEADPHMPPKKQLTDAQVKVVWPASTSTPHRAAGRRPPARRSIAGFPA